MICLILKEDMNQIITLGKSLHENFENLYSYESLVNEVDKTYKIVDNDKLIGFIHIQELIDEIDIIDIVIDNDYKNKGYGSELIKYIFEEYIDKRFILEVSVNNINAINFYKKHGFSVINTRKKYINDEDAYVMEKK